MGNSFFGGFVNNRGQILPKKGKKRVKNVIKKAWPLAVTNILMPDFRHAHTLQHTRFEDTKDLLSGSNLVSLSLHNVGSFYLPRRLTDHSLS